MTDSIKAIIDLSPLSLESRMMLQPSMTTDTDLSTGEIIRRYVKPQKLQSPVSSSKYTVLYECENPHVNPAPMRAHLDINLPSILVGQNYLHSTSVYMAGVASLVLVKRLFSDNGIPAEELNKLNLTHIAPEIVTLTYLLPCIDENAATELVKDIGVTLKILDKKTVSYESTNKTVTLEFRDFALRIYNKTDESHIRWAEEAPSKTIRELGRSIVRIEVKLRQSFLRMHGLTTFSDWKDGWAKGIYRKVFDQTVRRAFRFEDSLRHKAPRPEVLTEFTEQELKIVNGYLSGKNPRNFPGIRNSDEPAKRFSKLRLSILRKAQLDIGIPWELHKALKNWALHDVLVCPPDYVPPEELAQWCFCRRSWPNVRARLEQRADSAVVA